MGACSSSLLLSPSHTFSLLKHGSSLQAAIPVKKICCGVGSTQAVVPSGIPCAPAWGNPVTICTGAGLPRAAGNLCSGTEAPPCPSPLSLTLVFPLLLLTLWSFFLSLCGVSCIFLHVLFQVCQNHMAGGLCFGLWWVWLELAVSGPGQPPTCSCRSHPCSPLATYTKYMSVYLKACRATGRIKLINLDWLVYSDTQSRRTLAIRQQPRRKQKEICITVKRFIWQLQKIPIE